ncbi:putative short chain dehydrogenase [Escherichia coli]|nr:putative short chain dehydrogenase [Escherichia coli]
MNISSACVSTALTQAVRATAMRASAFPTEDPQKLKTPADIMPLYLWLMGDGQPP